MTRERLLKAFPNLTKLTALEEYLWINTSKGKKAITKKTIHYPWRRF